MIQAGADQGGSPLTSVLLTNSASEGGFRAGPPSLTSRAELGEREGGLRRVDRDERFGELLLASDDLAAVALELTGPGTGRAKRLTLLDERCDVALEALDAGIRIRHDSTYDV